MNAIVRIIGFLSLLLISSSGYSQSQDSENQGFSVVSGSSRQICALSTSGQLSCSWSEFESRLAPPDNLPLFEDVTVGSFHGCGLTEDGQVLCWGDNDFGQLNVPADSRFSAIEAGAYHSCGIQTDGLVQCWGANSNGQSTPRFIERVSNTIPPAPWADTFTSISNTDHPSYYVFIDQPHIVALDLNSQSSCGLDAEGVVHCWGDLATTFRPESPFDAEATVVDMGIEFSNAGHYKLQCAVMSDGTIACAQDSYQFDGRYSQVAGLNSLMCGLTLDGYVQCERTVGNNIPFTYHERLVIEQINEGEPLQSLDAEYASLCGITVSGSLRCGVINAGLVVPSDMFEPIEAPKELESAVYGVTTVELFWTPDVNPWEVTGAQIYRDDELIATTTQFSSFLDDTLEPGLTYQYRVRYVPEDARRIPAFSNLISVNTLQESLSAPTVRGNIISWSDDG